jgi:hypothetical protein
MLAEKKLPLDKSRGCVHGSAQEMRLTGTIYFDKRGAWSMWMARRVSRPTWPTALKVHQPSQQEEQT